jgi:hypothetical protein
MGWRPINPETYSTHRTVDVAVFHSQFGVQRSARQIAQSLPGRVDSVFGG